MANAEESAPADLSCTSAQQLLSQSMSALSVHVFSQLIGFL